MPGEDEVAHDEAAEGNAVVVDFEGGAHLALHLADGGGGHLGVVRRMAVAGGEFGVEVFEVGQVDVHEAFEGAEGLHRLVAGGVVHHRGVEPLGVEVVENLRYEVGVVGGGDEAQQPVGLGKEGGEGGE